MIWQSKQTRLLVQQVALLHSDVTELQVRVADREVEIRALTKAATLALEEIERLKAPQGDGQLGKTRGIHQDELAMYHKHGIDRIKKEEAS